MRTIPAVAFVVCLAAARLFAAVEISPVSPFVGVWSETWESRSTYNDPSFHYEPGVSPIMGGFASVASPRLLLYTSIGTDTTSLGTSGTTALVSDGVKGLAENSSSNLVTLSFSTPISAFGAYWGAATIASPPLIGV